MREQEWENEDSQKEAEELFDTKMDNKRESKLKVEEMIEKLGLHSQDQVKNRDLAEQTNSL